MSTDLDMEYQEVKFGDICREVKLTTKDPIADGYDKYIGLEHLDSGSLKIKRWGLIAEDNPTFTRVFKKGHILIGKRRPYLKKAAIAEFDGICSSDIIVVEGTQKYILSNLLPFLIHSNLFWDWAVKTSSGSLSPRTKFKDLSELKLSLIPFEKQKIFEPVLTKIQGNIALTEASLCSAINIKEIYSDSIYLNKTNQNPIGNHIDLLTGNPFSSKDFKLDGDFKLLRGINVTQGKIRWPEGDIKFWDEDKKLNKYRLDKNDVIISMDGSLVGKNYALIGDKNYENMYLVQRVARLRCNDTLNYKYLFHAIGSSVFKNYVDTVKTVTAIPHISPLDIRSFSIAIPEVKEQVKIACKLDAYQRAIESLQNKIDILNALKNRVIEEVFCKE